MKNTTPRRMRLRRFITDRYAYRAQLDYSSELITFTSSLRKLSKT